MMTEIKGIADGCTIGEAVRAGTTFLQNNNIDNADYDSFALLSHITGISRTDYFTKGDMALTEGAVSQFKQMLNKRAHHVPLQHIIGSAWFYGYEFYVNGDVLIPRPDTEILVSESLKVISKDSRILDMCTGSGCIILTLAKEAEISLGVGVDLSENALAVAEKNKKKLQAEQVQFIQSDIFKGVDESLYGNLDLIVSNPPYIRSDVIPTLSEEVRLHDPMMALDGFEDGLFFYREITRQACRYLKKGGWLMYEIGHDQGASVSKIMSECGFKEVSVIKDFAGLDRVVRGILI
ncbi:MAG: peptide chain release factor N(5)-glutamine methyltransferase [Eubacteriales bacterium]|nr:peptide chain release factor N(5)-glutamine methyltransferase [Eubacteriales bacterium]